MKGRLAMWPLVRRREDRRYIFVVTYGRSGSTLLMNLLNTGRGCCIRGENNGALYSIYQSCKKISEAQQGRGRKSHKTTSPWRGIGAVSVDRYAEELVRTFIEEVIRPEPSDIVCGFKEIRYLPKDVPDLGEYMDFLFRNFREAKIVFNHRNIGDVIKSKWWSEMPNAARMLTEADDRFREYVDPSKFFHFSYDTALLQRSHVEKLFEFANLTYDAVKIEEVFATQHSY